MGDAPHEPQLLLELPQLDNRVYACALHPDATRVAFGGVGKEVLVWDIEANCEVQRLYSGSNVQSVAFSPNGTALAAGGESKHTDVWDEQSANLPALGESKGKAAKRWLSSFAVGFLWMFATFDIMVRTVQDISRSLYR